MNTTRKREYTAADALAEVEDALLEQSDVASHLSEEGTCDVDVARVQGMTTVINHLRFRIRNIRRGEGL